MKHTRITLLVCLMLAVSIFFSGCPSPLVAYRYPGAQPNTVWSTKDGTAIFYIGASEIDPVYGSVQTGKGTIEIGIAMSSLVSIVEFYDAEDMRNWDNDHPPESFAIGQGTVVSRKEYQIEIIRADAFFESGQILTFYRIGTRHGTGDGSVC